MIRKIPIAFLAMPLLLNSCVSEPNDSTANARPIALPLTKQRILETGNLQCRKVGDINGPIYTVDGYPCPEGFFEVNGN